MKKFHRALLIVAPLVLVLAAPVGAQTQTPLVFTAIYAGDGCNGFCVDAIIDGDGNTGCDCWNFRVCMAEPVNVVDFEVLTDWSDGISFTPMLDGELSRYTRTMYEDPLGPRWFRGANLGQADCFLVSGLNVLGTPANPNIYEVRGNSGDGNLDVFAGSFWMVNKKVGQVLGAAVVSNFIYAILALAIGTLTLVMITRGLFGAAGAHPFGEGSGLGHSGSGMTYTSDREVGDVD